MPPQQRLLVRRETESLVESVRTLEKEVKRVETALKNVAETLDKRLTALEGGIKQVADACEKRLAAVEGHVAVDIDEPKKKEQEVTGSGDVVDFSQRMGPCKRPRKKPTVPVAEQPYMAPTGHERRYVGANGFTVSAGEIAAQS